MPKNHLPSLLLLSFASISLSIYVTGCGNGNTASAATVAASSGTGTPAGGSSSSNGGSDGGTSSSGSSGGGSSSGGSSSSGSSSGGSTSGSSGSGTSDDGNSGSGSSNKGNSGTASNGSSGDSNSGTSTSGAVIPAGALKVSAIQKLSNWEESYDPGTRTGHSTGEMSLTDSPSRSGSARKFVTSFIHSGGERYWVIFGEDTASTHFLYDAWVYFAKPSSTIANLEMDMNQVLSNGRTVIYGFQCDGNSSTWDYTKNGGTPRKHKDEWVHSRASCNPRKWSTQTWHHIQIEYLRDDAGNVTYKSVWLDGAKQDLNATVPSAFALGWTPSLLTNFQVDGHGAKGKPTVYLDNLTIYRW